MLIKLKLFFPVSIFFGILWLSSVLRAEEKLQAPLFNNLGSFHYKISTQVPLAQRFFDQGLTLFYGFEWNESIRSFKEATRLDPNCGMCYWGLALALAYKINAPITGHEYQDAKNAIQMALSLASHATPLEKAYIHALALRFQHPAKKVTQMVSSFSCHRSSYEPVDASSEQEMMNYIHAMQRVSEKYPQALEAKVLYAVALFWHIAGNNADYNNSNVQTGIKTLKSVLAKDQLNLGANHYYVHFVEPFSHPEDALESAHRLQTLVPGSEHLVHMPTHIYFLTGRYHEGTDANLQATAAYQNYNKICQQQGFDPEINYLYFHNYDFLRTTAAMEGRKELALSAAKQILAEPFPAWLKNESTLQWFIPVIYYVQARFGMWDAILKEPMPVTKYQYAVGMWHYARGMAWVHTGGKIKLAQDQLSKLTIIIHQGPIESNLGKSGLNLLKIAHAILAATIANERNDKKETIIQLQHAMQIQQSMGYHEPPDWYFPVKQVLGDAYLAWGLPKEAKAMYEADLKQYAKNGWSLYGLAKSLRKLGNDKEAESIEQEFKNAWKYADVPAPINLFEKSSNKK